MMCKASVLIFDPTSRSLKPATSTERVPFPMTNRVSQPGRIQVFGVRFIQRNEAEHVTRLDKNHDEFGRLDELIRI